MRVLHLTTHLNTGGITAYIEKLIKPFQALGIETHILSSGGELASELQAKGATVHILDIKTKSIIHPKLYLAIPRISKIIRENKIDLIHAHTRVTQVLAFFLQLSLKIPVLTTAHGFFKLKLARKLLPAWGNYVVAISDGVATALKEDYKLSDSKVVTIFNSIDLNGTDALLKSHNPVKIRSNYGAAAADPVIGVVARLVEDKGHEYLIRAVDKLKDKYPTIKLLIVGDGWHRKHLENLSSELGLKNHVIFTGNVLDITEPLSAMDIFVLPATWREGFGLSIIEAMACQKPVITTNIPALDTLISNNQTGILVEPKQIEPLASAIDQLLQNPSLGARLAKEGRMMVEKRFGIIHMASELENLYKKVSVCVHPT